MSVLIVGSVALDSIKTPTQSHENLLGGSASYASVAASFYGPVQMVGVVGTDFPEVHQDLFRHRKIDLEGLEIVPGETFRWSGEYEVNMNNRRTISVALNVFETFKPKLPASYAATDYVLLANIAPSLQMEVLKQMKKPKFVVADTMDLWITMAKDDLIKLLGQVDMLILNDSEAELLAGEGNTIKNGRRILEHGPQYVAIKKGEHGCLLFGRDQFFSIGAYPLADLQDPTGAGDCFVGALIGHLAATKDTSFDNLKKAVVQGTIVASFNVEAFSLARLEKLTNEEIALRAAEFRQYTHIA